MDDSAEVRDSARAAVGDVDPPGLRRELLDRIDDAWLVPGTLTVLAARRAGAGGLSSGLRSRAVGVQLIYEGLALTRGLVHEEPWGADDPEQADLEVLVADVLVARGAYLLARTEAADHAVELIRSFGRDQTGRPLGEPGHALEEEVFQLAAVAGSTAVADDPAAPLVGWAEDLAESLGDDDYPDVAALLARVEPTGSGGQAAVANEGRTGSSDP
jgi:hypothetical protein